MRNRQLSQHLGISEMTLHRWKRDPKLKTPKGMDVNGIEHNDVSEWDRWLRKRAVSRIEKASA
jgi:predicted site-specific integrase-resolvase